MKRINQNLKLLFKMKNIILFIFHSLLTISAYSQINGPTSACSGVTLTYSSASPALGYSWSVTGGAIIGPSNSYSVQVRFNNGVSGGSVRLQTSGGSFGDPLESTDPTLNKQGISPIGGEGTYTKLVTITPASVGGTISGIKSVCASSTSGTLSLSGKTGNVQYWQKSVDGGSTWSHISATSTSLNYYITQTTKYRAYVRSGSCPGAYSSTATITLTLPSIGGTMSGAKTGCGSVSGSLYLSGYRGNILKWQKSENGGISWSDINNTSYYQLYNDTKTTLYRVQVQNGGCSSVYSNTVTNTVTPSSLGGTIDGAQTVCALPASGTLILNGSRGNVLKWQKLEEGNSSWSNIPITSAYLTYSITKTTKYRAQVKNGSCAAVFSTMATVTVNSSAIGGTLSIDPSSNSSGCGSVNGTLLLSGYTGEYGQLQKREPGGDWENDGEMPVDRDGNPILIGSLLTSDPQPFSFSTDKTVEYRVEVKNSPLCTPAYSNILQISVDLPSLGGTLSGTDLECSDNPAQMTLSGNRGEIVKWQKQTGSGDWEDIDIITNTYTFEPYRSIVKFRVQVKNGACTPVYSSVATVRPKNLCVDECPTDNTRDINFVKTEDILKPGIKSAGDIYDLNFYDKTTSYAYTDGLGRVVQEVIQNGSPANKDMVKPFEFDEFNRQPVTYLSYASDCNTDGAFKQDWSTEQLNFYQQSGDVVPNDSRPYATNVYEASPMNRMLKSYGVGEDWFNNDRYVQGLSKIAPAGLVRKWYIDEEGLPNSNSTYSDNQLTLREAKDEENRVVQEYIDSRNLLVMKRTQISGTEWFEIYFVYDNTGSLTFVMPPEPSSRLDNEYFGNSASVKTAFLNRWCFQYQYDDLNRLVSKRVPGTEWTYTVYDRWDRPVLVQDGEMRKSSTWLFTKYDVLNRPIVIGKWVEAGTPNDLKSSVDNVSARYELTNTTAIGYTLNRTFPANPNDLLNITYYDDYDFISNAGWDDEALDYSFRVESGFDNTPYSKVKGKETGVKIRLLDQNAWLNEVIYYDDRHRPIQTIMENQFGHLDIQFKDYDFVDREIKVTAKYGSPNGVISITEMKDFDPQGRLLTIIHQIDDGPAAITHSNEYNELGNLIEKNLHSANGGGNFAQSVDYRHNIRGWLESINSSDLESSENNPDFEQARDFFGLELAYNQLQPGWSNSAHYNGNVSAVKWSNNMGFEKNIPSGITERAFQYEYDQLDRLTSANHKRRSGAWSDVNHFDVSSVTYDKNGNILNLIRKNETGSILDTLTYDYGTGANKSNKLLSVTDTGDLIKGFRDNNQSGDDYAYDDNGNLSLDKNKDISSIVYNHLNLPKEVLKSTGEKIEYLYDANGNKLRQSVFDASGSLIKKTDYIGSLIYENEVLKLIQFSDGRVISHEDSYEYQYHIKDQVENVRLTFTTSPEEFSFNATMESENADDEDVLFENINRVNFPSANHTPGGNEAVRVNGAQTAGPGIALPVNAGDNIEMEVWAYYEGGSGYSTKTSITNFVSALAGAFGGIDGGNSTEQALYNSINGAVNGAQGFATMGTSDDLVPGAYLSYTLFDQNMISYQQGHKQISTAAKNSHELVDFSDQIITASKPGFIYVYVSTTSASGNWVYFDDMNVTLTEHPVIQTDDYYPFGLTFNSYQRVSKSGNQFKFNGKERQDELDLAWDDFGARMYSSQIGRWQSVDPLADHPNQLAMSSYSAMWNNHVKYNDPDGRCLSPAA